MSDTSEVAAKVIGSNQTMSSDEAYGAVHGTYKDAPMAGDETTGKAPDPKPMKVSGEK